MLLASSFLERYQLVRRLDGDGTGTVYLVRDPHTPGQVALKVISIDHTEDIFPESKLITRRIGHLFTDTMRASSLPAHPHILPIVDFGVDEINGVPGAYVAMQYAPSGSLADWLSQTELNSPCLPLSVVAHILSQTASALHFAHERGILHQDIKPTNLLLSTSTSPSTSLPDILLADFGLARFFATTSSQGLSQSSYIRSSYPYLAPEQWDGAAVPASDQYALAILAFSLLTGHFPFQGSLSQVIEQHYKASPPAPSSLNPQLMPALDKIIKRALAKDPRRRFPSVLDFAQALAHLVERSDARAAQTHSHASLPPPARLPAPIIDLAAEILIRKRSRPSAGAALVEAPLPLASWPARDNDDASTTRVVKPAQPSFGIAGNTAILSPSTELHIAPLANGSAVQALFSSTTTSSVPVLSGEDTIHPANGVAETWSVSTPPRPFVSADIRSLLKRKVGQRRVVSARQKSLLVALSVLVLLIGSSALLFKPITSSGHGQFGSSSPSSQGTQISQGSGNHGGIVLAASPTSSDQAPSIKPTPGAKVTPTIGSTQPAPQPTTKPTPRPAAPTPRPTPKPTPKPVCPATIENGSTGSLVSSLQRELNARGVTDSNGDALVVDGQFGPLTESAVKKWQTREKIEVDGVVGPITWHTLGNC